MTIANRRSTLSLLAVVAPWALACGGNSTGDGHAGPDRTITISGLVSQQTEDGTAAGDVPLPLVPTVQLDDGSSRAVTQTAPGKWSATVAAGPCWVVLGSQHFRVTGSSIDLGYATTTRANAAPPTRATPVALSLSGLRSWAANDRLQLFSWGANSWDVFDPQFAAGTTSANALEDWNTPNYGHGALNLLAPADTLYVLHYGEDHDAANGLDYWHVVGWTQTTNITQADGEALNRTLAPMQAPAQSGSLTLDWRTTQFEAAAAAFDQPNAHQLTVFAQGMRPGAENPWAASPNLLDTFVPPGTPNRSVTGLHYDRFLPAAYQEVLYTDFGGWVLRSAPGGPPLYGYATVNRRDPVSAIPSPLVPLVSVVRAPQLEGRDATTPQHGLGLTPTLSWSPPAVGTPQQIQVRIYEIPVGVSSTEPGWIPRDVLVLGAATSVQIPPGLLASGKSYVFGIQTRVGVGGEAAPSRSTLPGGNALMYTQVYTP